MAVCPNKECRSTNTKYLDTRHRQESRATKEKGTTIKEAHHSYKDDGS